MNFDWSKILSQGESLQKEFGVSRRFLNGIIILSVFVALILSLANIFAGILLFLLGIFYWFYLKKSKHYALTDKRAVFIDSFLGTNVISVDYKQITDVEIEQSYFDQLGGWGTFVINTAGTHSPIITLMFVDNPQNLKQLLDQIKDAQK